MFIKWRYVICFFFSVFMMISGGFSRDYIIYTISQEISMGHKKEKLNKNFYVNMGKNQGLQEGTLLDVFRVISQLDPYNNNVRYNHRVKIGELKVLHVEENSSITRTNLLMLNESGVEFDIKNFMIGDQVSVHINYDQQSK